MKGLKFLASCAVVGAVAAACATASFAADYTATASYDSGTVTIAIPADYVAATDGDLTLLILSEDATSITESNKSIVKQIQQGDSTALSEVAVGDLADGTYYVRIGGAEVGQDNPNGFIATTFTVGGTSQSVLVGDVNGDESITASDATEIFKNIALMESSVDNGEVNFAAAAYCSGDESITAADATEVFKYIALLDVDYVGTTMDLEN
jgi:hypothetical protein